MLDEAKTKDVKTGALAKQFGKLGFGKALIVDGEFDKNFQLSRPQSAPMSRCCRPPASTSMTS